MGTWLEAAVVAGGLMVSVGCSGGGAPARPDAASDAAVPDRPADAPLPGDAAADRPADAPADRATADAGADLASDLAADLAPDSQRGDLPLPASFVLLPESHDFQIVPTGMSRTKIFELKNIGGQNSGTPSISLMGGPEDVFKVIDNLCLTSLEPDGSCTIEVQFSPTAAGPQGVLLEAEASPGGRVSSQINGTGQ